MKGFRRIISIVVALMLVCSSIPISVLALGSDSLWSDTNLVEGQADILLNNYNPTYLDVTLDKDVGYRLDYTITFNTNVAGKWNYMSNMLRESESDLISFGAWNDASDGTGQLRFAENDIANISQTAVEGVGVIPAGVGFPISIVIMPDYLELYVGGQLQTMYLTSGGTATQIPVSKRIENGKVGFIGQGSNPDITISNIALYCEAGADVPVKPEIEWSDTNLVQGQPNLTLDYFWKWMPTTIKGSESYKYCFNFIAPETTSSRYPTVAVRDVSENSDGEDGLYVVFNNIDDQIRIGTHYTTNGDALLAVAGNAGLKPAGTYKVEIITTPNAIKVYMNGNLITFTDMVSGNYQLMTEVPTKEFADAKAGFITQGAVVGTQITDIAIYGEAGVEVPGDSQDTIEWSDTNLVEGQGNLILNDYVWDWLPVELDKDVSYKYNFNLTVTDTNGYRLPTVAVRDSSANSDGTDGLYIVFYGVEDQIRIGYEATTYKSLIGVATNVGMDPAGTYAVEIISTPDSISVSINGTPVSFLDYSDGQTKTKVAVSGLKDGKTGFNAQGTVMDSQITDIAIYKDKNLPDAPQVDEAAVENVIGLINAIGIVSEESKDAIDAARDAYNALNDDEKALVTNIDTLKQAETTYNQLTASQDIMLYSLAATDAMGYNHWTQFVGITNVTGGGMRFNWTNAGTNMRQGINRSVKLDGLHAVFSGWEATKGSNSIAIYLADLDSQESYTQILKDNTSYYYPLALILNGVDGTLGVASADDSTYPITVIATSDALKYDALAGKEWSLFMNANGDGSYTVTVNGVSGIITKEMLEACNKLTQTESVYITICPWDWAGQTTGSLSVISLHDGDNVCANNLTSVEMNDVLKLIEQIKSIGIVTADSLEIIEACEAAYEKLDDTQKGCVVNYNVLLAARYRYEQITQEVDEPCLNYYSVSTADLAGTNHWPNNLFYNDIADGGVKFEWINAGTNFRRLINREVTLDGLHMLFSGLEAEDSVKKIALYCADIYDTAADWTSLYSEYVQGEPSILALIFDFSEGTLTAHVEGQSDVVIINDSRITYEYLKDVIWELRVEKNSDGDYVFNVAGATGVLPAALCDAANRLTNRDKSMYITLSPWNWNPYNVAIDILAIHGKSVVCAEELTDAQVVELNKVIDAINNIYTEDGKIIPESEEKFITAWELYDTLATNLQPLVANYGYLLVAEEVLDVVLAIESIGTVTYESGDFIEQIRQMYKDLAITTKENNSTALQRVEIDIDKRVMVGNYATLNKAISDYYNLRKGLDLNGYTPDDSTDNTQNNDTNNSGDTLSPNTGDDRLFTSVIMLSSIMAVAVIIYKKKIRKES